MADLVSSPSSAASAAPLAAAVVQAAPRPIPTPQAARASSVSEGHAATPSEPASPSKGELEAAVKKVATFVQQSSSDLHFGVDKETGQYYFKVVDPKTNQTIRQVPSEEILAMARRLQQLSDSSNAKGVLVDAKG